MNTIKIYLEIIASSDVIKVLVPLMVIDYITEDNIKVIKG